MGGTGKSIQPISPSFGAGTKPKNSILLVSQGLRHQDELARRQKQSYRKAEILARKSHFNVDEVRSLQVLYAELVSQGRMDRLRFREIMCSFFDMTDDVMLDRIFRIFDTNNDATVDEGEWVLGLSVLLRGTLQEYIHFCYSIYDINGDQILGREELFFCLKNSLIRSSGIEEDVEESIKDIVEIAMKKLDVDKNGKISFHDFEMAVSSDPLLLEACGPCLPPSKAVNDFLATFQFKYPPPKLSLRIIMMNKARKGQKKRSQDRDSRVESSPGSKYTGKHSSPDYRDSSRRSSPARKSPDRKSPSTKF